MLSLGLTGRKTFGQVLNLFATLLSQVLLRADLQQLISNGRLQGLFQLLLLICLPLRLLFARLLQFLYHLNVLSETLQAFMFLSLNRFVLVVHSWS